MEQDQAAVGDLLDECPEVSRIALASAGSRRDIWLAAFALDGRIGRMVLGASEPMLGQMRLAWWRDQLGAPASARPQGDLLLDLIGRTWADNELPLLALVDGWEALLGERPFGAADMQRFIDGRAGVARGLAARLGAANAEVRAEAAGRIWARADLAAYASEDGERDRVLDQERSAARAEGQLPAALRPLAVIEGLARRSLRAGGGPMLGDRLSPLVALRLGLFGR